MHARSRLARALVLHPGAADEDHHVGGPKSSAFEHIGQLYRQKLASHHVTLTIHYIDVANDNVRLINDPKSGVSAAFLFTGQTNAEESPDLLSLGRIDNAPLWIFYRAATSIERLTQLKGKRLNISPAVAKLVNEVLAAHGVNAGNAKMRLIPHAVSCNPAPDGPGPLQYM